MGPAGDLSCELICESAMPPDVDRSIKALLCTCFPRDADAFRVSRHWHGSAPQYSVVLRDGPDIVGHVGVVVRPITCGGKPVVIAGVQNFAVAPPWRGRGLGPRLMAEAMTEARRRELDYGLLFCLPALEPYYAALGWRRTHVRVFARFDGGPIVELPDYNVTMYLELGPRPFPPGDIDLCGPDF